MQVDIRHQGANDASLRRTLLHHVQLAVLHHASFLPPHHQTNHAWVSNPMLEKLLQMSKLDGVKIRLHIRVEHPAYLPADRFSQCIERIVCRPARSEPV